MGWICPISRPSTYCATKQAVAAEPRDPVPRNICLIGQRNRGQRRTLVLCRTGLRRTCCLRSWSVFRPSRLGACERGGRKAISIHRLYPEMLCESGLSDLRLERGFDRPVRRLNGDHARPSIGDTASLADALDLRTLLREFASAQD